MAETDIQRVSTASDGTQGNSDSFVPSLSADGSRVAFQGYAFNLVPGDTNSAGDIFVKDLAGGGVVPFLSFVVEKRMTRVVRDELHRFPDAARRY